MISIHPEIPKLGNRPFHRNIKIEDNVFLAFDASLLWAKSVDRLAFRKNEIAFSNAYKAWHPNREGLTFIGCENVRVGQNKVDKRFLGQGVRIEGGSRQQSR